MSAASIPELQDFIFELELAYVRREMNALESMIQDLLLHRYRMENIAFVSREFFRQQVGVHSRPIQQIVGSI